MPRLSDFVPASSLRRSELAAGASATSDALPGTPRTPPDRVLPSGGHAPSEFTADDVALDRVICGILGTPRVPSPVPRWRAHFPPEPRSFSANDII